MKKNQQRWQGKKKPHCFLLSHIVQARITYAQNTHVCVACGEDAHFCSTHYEVTTEAQTMVFLKEVEAHMEDGTLSDEALRQVLHLPLVDQVYEATLQEQREVGIREHGESFRCFSCIAQLLSLDTGTPYGGEAMLGKMLAAPEKNAIFVVRRTWEPERSILMNAPFRSPEKALAALQHEDAIPRLKMTVLRPEDGET